MSIHIFFAKISWLLLIFLLLLRPLADIFGWKLLRYLMQFRKHVGIACGTAAVLHAGLFLAESNLGLPYFGTARFWDFSTLWGWGNLALLAMLFPLLTSNRYSQRLLKRHWKPFQQITYFAFIFTAIHVAFAKQEWLAGLIPVVIWSILWSWAAWKKTTPPIAQKM